jgi:hypothetical protein
VCVQKTLATSSLLVKKSLTTGGLLAFVGGMLVKESLATIGLLAVVSSALVEEALGGMLIKKLLQRVTSCR